MRHLRAISITATTAAFCVISGSSWAQQIGDQNVSPFESLTRFLHVDPLLVVATVIAMTLVIGLALDFLRGRFQRSEDNEAPTSN